FQAEDGIRAGHVTGVQTCALPIWFQGIDFHRQNTWKPFRCHLMSVSGFTTVKMRRQSISHDTSDRLKRPQTAPPIGSARRDKIRSEERRVGKECRYRWRSEL